MSRVAFFTSSMGGGGHLSRAFAVYHGLRRQGFSGDYRAFTPPIPYSNVEAPFPLVQLPFPVEQQRHPTLARNSALARALCAFRPDLLIVDTFWLPALHLLPLLRCEAWLLLRWVPPTWISVHGAPDPRALFRRVLRIEPAPNLLHLPLIGPVVLCNPGECHPPGALKARLGVPLDQRLTLVLQAGRPGELERLRRELSIPEDEAVRTLTLHDGSALYPAAPWLPGADRLVGGAGYNFYWETTWLGLRDRTHYQPFDRDMDDQGWRVLACARIKPTQNGADQLAAWVMAG